MTTRTARRITRPGRLIAAAGALALTASLVACDALPGPLGGKDPASPAAPAAPMDPEQVAGAETVPVERTDRKEDGSLEVVLRVADPGWLQRLVWRQAGQVRVLAPAEVVQAVAEGTAEAVSGHTQTARLD